MTASGIAPESGMTENPFFESWTTPFGMPPFARIAPEHFMPAYDRAFAEHEAQIAAIAADPSQPTFVVATVASTFLSTMRELLIRVVMSSSFPATFGARLLILT